jgi:cell division protein ZipA
MNNLRLILLGIGIAIIASIYVWETVRQRRLRRRDIEPVFTDHVFPDEQITPKQDADADYSGALADLNDLLVDKRRSSGKSPVEQVALKLGPDQKQDEPQNMPVLDTDLADEYISSAEGEKYSEDKPLQAVTDEPILVLYVTAPKKKTFTGLEIGLAAEMAGMEYGVMNIFHHFGVDQSRSKQPLFSMANMFEPGIFNLDDLDSMATRGVVVFMCQTSPADKLPVFDLLLNTVQQLAEFLGGEIRDSDHELLTEEKINALRDKVQQISI